MAATALKMNINQNRYRYKVCRNAYLEAMGGGAGSSSTSSGSGVLEKTEGVELDPDFLMGQTDSENNVTRQVLNIDDNIHS